MTEPKLQETGETADRIIGKLGNPIAGIMVVMAFGFLWMISFFQRDANELSHWPEEGDLENQEESP